MKEINVKEKIDKVLGNNTFVLNTSLSKLIENVEKDE